MHVSLGKRNFNARLGEGVVDSAVQAVHESSTVLGTFNPAQELEVQRRVAEFTKTCPRFRILSCQGIGTHLLYQNGLYLLDVRAVGDTDPLFTLSG
jgi:hypothetical protein